MEESQAVQRRRWYRLLLCFALPPLLSLAAPAGAQVEQLVDGCDQAYARYQTERAHELARRAAQMDPASYEALWRLCRSQVDLGEEALDRGDETGTEQWYAKALKTSEELLRAAPGEANAHYYRALALGRRAVFAGGREKVELSREIEQEALRALELEPEHARAHGLIGRYYREMAHLSWFLRTIAETLFGDMPEGGDELALRHLLRSAELMPEWTFAHFELGETYAVTDRPEQARAEFLRVIEMPVMDHRDEVLKQEARQWLEKLD